MRLADHFKKKSIQFRASIVNTLQSGKEKEKNITPFRSAKPMTTREDASRQAEGEFDTYNIVEKGVVDLFGD